MAKQSGASKFAEGLVQTILALVIASLIVAGITAAYLAGMIILVILGIVAIVIVAFIYFRWARSKAKAPRPKLGLPLRTPGTLQSFPFQRAVQPRTGVDARPKERLKHVVTVSLDTEVVPFDHRSEWFEEGDIIEVKAESQEGASFHFMVCDDEQLRINKRRSVNFEYDEGKEFTTQFKKRFEIPESGMWHFIAYTPYDEDYTKVTLTVSKVESRMRNHD